MRLFKISVQQHVIDEVTENYQSRFDDIFDDKDRIVISMENDWIRNVITKLKEGKTKTGTKYDVDANLDYVWKSTSGKAKNPTKIGRIIAFELGEDYLTEWSRQKADMSNGEKLSIVISRSPVDIVRMSDWYELHSCHAPGGDYFSCAKEEASAGGAVAFLVKTEDITDVSEEDLQATDLFHDKNRRTGKNIKPLSRLRINRYVNSEDESDELGIPMDALYGRKLYPFFTNTKRFFLEQQKDKIAELMRNKGKLKSYMRAGGSYRDMNDSDIMKDFFDEDMGINGNLDSKSTQEIQRRQWEEEINQAVDRFKNSIEEHVLADVYAELDNDMNYDDLHLNAGVVVRFEIHHMINKNSAFFKSLGVEDIKDAHMDLNYHEWGTPEGINYHALFSKSLKKKVRDIFSDPFNHDATIRFQEYEPITDGFEVAINWSLEEYNPDGFSQACYQLADELNKKYHLIYRAINESLAELDVIPPIQLRGAQLNEQQLNVLESNLDHDIELCDFVLPNRNPSSSKLSDRKRTLIYKEKEITDAMYSIMDLALSAAVNENRNPKNQTTFNFYEQTKSVELPVTIPTYWLKLVNYIGSFDIIKAAENPNSWSESRYMSHYTDANEGKIVLFIPYSEVYSQGAEYFLHIFSKLDKIQSFFSRRLTQELNRISSESPGEQPFYPSGPPQTNIALPYSQRTQPKQQEKQEEPEEQEKQPEEVKAGAWYHLYKIGNV